VELLSRHARLVPRSYGRANHVGKLSRNRFDRAEILALDHDANDGLGTRWAEHDAAARTELSLGRGHGCPNRGIAFDIDASLRTHVE
jgi:hypothetical protein